MDPKIFSISSSITAVSQDGSRCEGTERMRFAHLLRKVHAAQQCNSRPRRHRAPIQIPSDSGPTIIPHHHAGLLRTIPSAELETVSAQRPLKRPRRKSSHAGQISFRSDFTFLKVLLSFRTFWRLFQKILEPFLKYSISNTLV